MRKPPWQRKHARLLRRLHRWLQRGKIPLRKAWDWIEPAWPALAVSAALGLIIFLFPPVFSAPDEFYKGIYFAAWGAFLDILLVAVILVVFDGIRRRRQNINRYIEEIDDYKKLDSEEARLRIAGNIRRLARLGKTSIDFSGIILRNFSFYSQDIECLRGATFSMGLRIDRMSKNSTELEGVDFSHIDCRGVVFSRSFDKVSAFGLIGKNLHFVSANLADASFEGAKLSWTEYKAAESEWFLDLGEDDDGRSRQGQVHYPAFAEADLKGCSFRYAELDHADFRGAENILEADFTGTKGLTSCFFDEDVRVKVLTSATIGPTA
jgi:uncharacterized protein YjbI with pentapeptide repeats